MSAFGTSVGGRRDCNPGSISSECRWTTLEASLWVLWALWSLGLLKSLLWGGWGYTSRDSSLFVSRRLCLIQLYYCTRQIQPSCVIIHGFFFSGTEHEPLLGYFKPAFRLLWGPLYQATDYATLSRNLRVTGSKRRSREGAKRQGFQSGTLSPKKVLDFVFVAYLTHACRRLATISVLGGGGFQQEELVGNLGGKILMKKGLGT